MPLIDLTSIAEHVLTECREDYVGLWSIVWRIRGAGVEDDSQVYKLTVLLLANLLSEQKIKAGQFLDQKFDEWTMPPREVIAKIGLEWKSLGRDPDIGEIAWFVAETTK